MYLRLGELLGHLKTLNSVSHFYLEIVNCIRYSRFHSRTVRRILGVRSNRCNLHDNVSRVQDWSQTLVWLLVQSSSLKATVRLRPQISEQINSIRLQASLQIAAPFRLPFRFHSASSQTKLDRFSPSIGAVSRQLLVVPNRSGVQSSAISQIEPIHE